MKQLEVQVPQNQIEVVEDLVNSYKLNCSQLDLIGGDRLFIIKVEDNESNNLLHELKARGIGDVFGEITVFQANLHIAQEKAISSIEKSSAANLEEILANIEDNSVISGSYLALVILSGALAAFGLISNSVVIIIGSMIVAPLLGPVALTSIGILLPESDVLKKGLTAEFVGIILTIAIGILVGLLFEIQPTQQMIERADNADILNVAFAIFSGIAAGVIISKGESLSIVGVAIAASLAPPAANIGLYLALGQLDSASISAALLMINIFAINACCSIIFSIYRLPSKAGISKRRASKVQRKNNWITFFTVAAFFTLSIYLFIELQNLQGK